MESEFASLGDLSERDYRQLLPDTHLDSASHQDLDLMLDEELGKGWLSSDPQPIRIRLRTPVPGANQDLTRELLE